jgi:phosphoribosylanthranilate isomerase
MRVKICGLTRAEDARLAKRLGAWALGFVFAESPRRVTEEQAREIVSGLKDALTVGVFVNQENAPEIARRVNLKALQLHGDETPGDCFAAKSAFGGTVIKALRPAREEDLDAIAAYKGAVDYILIDAAAPGQYGGSGTAADWALAAKAGAFGTPVILAGGLNAENIAAAARAARPFALDLSSGAESAPGVKDARKLERIFAHEG